MLATVPNDVFERLLDPALAAEVGEAYLARARGIEYFAALCLLLEIDRAFSPYYWTNVADRALPFVGLIEHTNFVEPERYGGRRFLYVANYLPHGHELLELDADALLARYEPGLRAVNPAFSRAGCSARWRFAEPAAQPIVTVGYGERIPPLRTPAPGSCSPTRRRSIRRTAAPTTPCGSASRRPRRCCAADADRRSVAARRVSSARARPSPACRRGDPAAGAASARLHERMRSWSDSDARRLGVGRVARPLPRANRPRAGRARWGQSSLL